ncbi:amino acid adenylation domain-containing protein [Pseudomonas caspiana]|nr:amino acid adenylation domain-containing protein [Pseudomonas caspiana]TPG90029.1 amino acid adenylation domain-containing protein [Pseudomonas caspiana]
MILSSLNDRSLPLLDTQVGLWISEQVNQAETSHNIPIRLSIRGALDVSALQQAIDWLVRRHDNLRARFVLDGETPRQIISTTVDTAIEHVLITAGERDTGALEARIDALLQMPMDITQGPLFRSVLLELDHEHYLLLFVIHHLVFDGSSIDVLLRDVLAGYASTTQGTDDALQLLSVSYAEYVKRQEANQTPDSLNYWLKELADRPTPQRFPCARPADAKRTRKALDVVNTLDQATTEHLRTLTGPGTFTPFMVHMAVCAVLLHHHTGVEDMVFGMPLSTRDNADMNDLTGLFVNVVPLRLRLTPEMSFAMLLKHVRARILRAMMHRHLAFHDLIGQLRRGQEAGSGSLFQIFLNHASVHRRPVQVAHCDFELLPTTNTTAAFEMNLAIVETESGFDTVFEFDDMLFDRSDITALAENYHHILVASLQNPDTAVSNLQLRAQITMQRDEHKPQRPSSLPVHQWFEAQVQRDPDSVALVFEETRLSYRELNAQANQVAAFLRNAGVASNVLVGICIDRSPQMVIAILAVLKAGAAYLPIDPDNPDERIHFILEDTAVRTLLTSSHLHNRFLDRPVNLICLEEPAQFAGFDSCNAGSPAALHDLAYCIYTSGSTGQPKGALNTHGGFANLVQWYVRDGLHMSSDDRVMLASSIGFDLTQKNILGPLCVGACLMIPAHSPAHASGFLKALNTYRPTWLNCAPSAFRAFAGSARTASLRTLVLGGEPVDAALIEQLRGRPLTLVNSYGPTECSDVATWYAQDLQSLATGRELPLGRAIPGVQVYVLDERLQPLPDGVPGEIHIAGTGVGQGYLKRAALTAEKFIPNPDGPAGSRMYKTGDLGRRQADGTLEFIGRIDFQVKVRGHRIELGEIENQLLACDSIREAVVVALEVSPGEKRLVAYLVADGANVPDSQQLSGTLRQSLLDYMVPDTWIVLPCLPLNINGKLDRKALPSPDWLQRCEPTGANAEPSASGTMSALRLTPIKRQPRVSVYDEIQ